MRLRCARPPEVQTRVERLRDGRSVHLIYSNHTQRLLLVGEDFLSLWRRLGEGQEVPAVLEALQREEGLTQAEAATALRSVLETCRQHQLLQPVAG